MRRELHDHKVNEVNAQLRIWVADEPGQGGASHVYDVTAERSGDLTETLGRISFQNGTIKEAGVNGVTQETLLAIVADRLRSFQAGQYACRENAIALTHIETAQLWLHKRTRERQQRGVEGTHVK